MRNPDGHLLLAFANRPWSVPGISYSGNSSSHPTGVWDQAPYLYCSSAFVDWCGVRPTLRRTFKVRPTLKIDNPLNLGSQSSIRKFRCWLADKNLSSEITCDSSASIGPNFTRGLYWVIRSCFQKIGSSGTAGAIGEAFKSAYGNEHFIGQKFAQKAMKTFVFEVPSSKVSLRWLLPGLAKNRLFGEGNFLSRWLRELTIDSSVTEVEI